MKSFKKIVKIGSGAFVGLYGASAFAAMSIDITPVTDALTAGTVAIGAIGAAVLGFYAIKKVWSLVRP